jgi:hypothetical protein
MDFFKKWQELWLKNNPSHTLYEAQLDAFLAGKESEKSKMSVEELLGVFEDDGWDYSIGWDGNEYDFTILRKEWVTDNLYAARPCPTWRNATLFGAISLAAKDVMDERG